MTRFIMISAVLFTMIFSFGLYSSGEVNIYPQETLGESDIIEVAGGRLFIGMSKMEAFDVEGVPYRVKRLKGEEGKEMWIYRCNNDDGFDEDCLYLYFNGDELDKIERP